VSNAAANFLSFLCRFQLEQSGTSSAVVVGIDIGQIKEKKLRVQTGCAALQRFRVDFNEQTLASR